MSCFVSGEQIIYLPKPRDKSNNETAISAYTPDGMVETGTSLRVTTKR